MLLLRCGCFSCFCALSGGFVSAFLVGCSTDEQVYDYTTSGVLELHSGVAGSKRAVLIDNSRPGHAAPGTPLLQIGRVARRAMVHYTEGSVAIDAIDATRPGEGRWTPPRAPDNPRVRPRQP